MHSARPKVDEDDDKIIKSPIFVLVCSFTQIMMFYSTGEATLLYLQYDPYRRQQLWRYFTPMLLHGSSGHLWSSVICQLVLGTMLEMEQHSARIAILYILGGLGGTLLTGLVHPDEYVIGASAGVYSIVFAHIANMLINWETMSYKRARVFMPSLYAVLSISVNIYITVQSVQRTPTYEFAHVGHAGGSFTGFLLSFVILKYFEKIHWRTIIRRLSGALLLISFITIVSINIFYPSHFPPTEYNEDYVEPYYRHAAKMVNNSEPNSLLREYCDKEEHCAAALKELTKKVLKVSDSI